MIHMSETRTLFEVKGKILPIEIDYSSLPVSNPKVTTRKIEVFTGLAEYQGEKAKYLTAIKGDKEVAPEGAIVYFYYSTGSWKNTHYMYEGFFIVKEVGEKEVELEWTSGMHVDESNKTFRIRVLNLEPLGRISGDVIREIKAEIMNMGLKPSHYHPVEALYYYWIKKGERKLETKEEEKEGEKKEEEEGELIWVDPRELLPPLFEREETLETEDIEESIRERGLIEPIVARRLPDGKLRVVGGNRRRLVAIKLGLDKVPVYVKRIRDDTEELLISAEENIARKDLSTREMYKLIKLLVEKGLNKKQIQERLKISRSVLYRILWLDELPADIRSLFLDEKIALWVIDDIHKALQELPMEDIIDAVKTSMELEKEERAKFIRDTLRALMREKEVKKQLEEKKEEKREEEESIAETLTKPRMTEEEMKKKLQEALEPLAKIPEVMKKVEEETNKALEQMFPIGMEEKKEEKKEEKREEEEENLDDILWRIQNTINRIFVSLRAENDIEKAKELLEYLQSFLSSLS